MATSKKKELRLDKLVTHVVDWHNAHPLVRRISGLRVHTMGFVAVPYLAPPGTPVEQLQAAAGTDPVGGTLRQRAMERAGGEYITDRTQPVPSTPPGPPVTADDAAFDEAFFAPYDARRLARWVAQHGSGQPRIPRGASVRQIQPRADVDMNRVHWRWVLTAQVDRGTARIRLLVGAGEPPAVLGPRMWSPARIAGVLLAAAGLLGVVAGLTGRGGGAPAPAAPAAPASAVVQVAPAAASAPRLAPAASAASAVAAAPTPVQASGASRPVDVDPQLGRVDLPSLGPLIDERRRRSEQSRAEAASAARAQAAAPAFAVWTRTLRTRAESEQMADAMRDLLRSPDNPKLRVEVLAVGQDWRVVGWPYPGRTQADQARELLAARGLRVEVVEF